MNWINDLEPADISQTPLKITSAEFLTFLEGAHSLPQDPITGVFIADELEPSDSEVIGLCLANYGGLIGNRLSTFKTNIINPPTGGRVSVNWARPIN